MNPGTLADYIRYVEPSLDGSLVETGYSRRIESIARHFPARLCGIFGFETHLTDLSGRADFAFKITNDEVVREILHSVLTGLGPGTNDESWRSLQAFCAAWRSGESRFNRDLAGIWLEFDIDPGSVLLPAPSLFVIVKPLAAIADYAGLFGEIVRHFRGPAFLESIEKNLGRCLDRLPENASIPLFGLMLSRLSPAVRLSVYKLGAEQIFRYLNDLRWPGDQHTLGRVLNFADTRTTGFVLDLDAGESLFPTTGLEFYFRESRLPARPYRWERFLDTLVTEKLCHPGKREALLWYPGPVAGEQNKPANLVMAESLLGHHRSVWVKKISHFKVVFEADRILSAKAYLEARMYWVEKGTTARSGETRACI